jgi:hypothetical protein
MARRLVAAAVAAGLWGWTALAAPMNLRIDNADVI